jgi:malonate decarboxylase epsilon subunit
MTRLYPSGFGLSAIVGLTESQVAAIVEATSSDDATVFVGNINAPRQIVFDGEYGAMDRALEDSRN